MIFHLGQSGTVDITQAWSTQGGPSDVNLGLCHKGWLHRSSHLTMHHCQSLKKIQLLSYHVAYPSSYLIHNREDPLLYKMPEKIALIAEGYLPEKLVGVCAHVFVCVCVHTRVFLRVPGLFLVRNA